MTFPPDAVRACDVLAAQFVTLAHGTDDQRRTLTRLIGEQLAYSLGDRWGNKKRTGLADEYRSKDAIAYREDDGTVSCWDWQNGDTRERGVNEGDPPKDPHLAANAATFMACTPMNHLGWGEQPPQAPAGEPAGEPVGESLQRLGPDVRASLGRIEARQLGRLVDGDDPAGMVFDGELRDPTGTVVGTFTLTARRLG